MKRYHIDYTERWHPGPMTFWVHIEADGKPWHSAKLFSPPAPPPVPGKGYPRFFVEVDELVFQFASLVELDVCINTLSKKTLPPTERETDARGTGPSKHWLNRLPAGAHSWRYRQKALKVLLEARDQFRKELTDK